MRLLPLSALLVLSAALSACSEEPTQATVECASDAECGADKRCDSGKCVAVEKPVPCASSAECAVDLVCRGGACASAACKNDGECDQFESCIDGACRFEGCRGEADCTGGTHCDTVLHQCVECQGDGDCPAARPVCRKDGKCIQCGADTDCGGALPPFCNRATGTCVTCVSDDNCPTGLHCGPGVDPVTKAPVGQTCVGKKAGEACVDEACEPGLICINQSTGGSVCVKRCDVYAPACDVGKVCTMIGDGSGAIAFEFGKPVGICYDPLPGGANLGDSCGNGVSCQRNLYCIPEAYQQGRCKKLCDPTAATSGCAAPDTCNKMPAGTGTGEDIGICYQAGDWNKLCTRDGDCPAGMGCGLSLTPDTTLETRCAYAASSATKSANESCALDTDCKSGFCLDDAASKGMFCYAACAADADCPNGFCDNYTFTVDTQGTTATIKGCHAGCASNPACAAFGSAVCIATNKTASSTKPARVEGECRAAIGSAALGAACTAASGCSNGRCETSDSRAIAQKGYCTTLCAAQADCPAGFDCPADGSVVIVGSGPDATRGTADDVVVTARLCTGVSCVADADCTASGLTVCRLEQSPTTPKSGLVKRCGPPTPSGTKKGGDSCATNTECLSGTCFALSTGSKVCFQACDPAATTTGCPANTTCTADAAEVEAPDKTKVKFSACVP